MSNSLNSSDCVNWIFLTNVASVAMVRYGIIDNINGINPFRSQKLTLSKHCLECKSRDWGIY